jgi:hypothetical protein
MANLKLISDAMFTNKVNWKDVPDDEKESCFFIINRMFSKKYPEKSQLLNLKTIDKVTSMDLWYSFMKGKPYPNWFWSKIEKVEKSKIPNIDYKLLLQKLKIKDIDLDYLIEHHIDFIKEELVYIKKLINQN